MLSSVRISRAAESPYTIPLVRPSKTNLIIRSIDGLGAGKAELHSSARASLDGNAFNGARLGPRNITMQLGFGSQLDPELGRDLAYGVFAIKQMVSLLFTTDLRRVIIDGYVESNEPSIFTNDPALDISIVCMEPHFRSIVADREVIDFYTLEDKFEFPFSNESLTDNLLVMGDQTTGRYQDVRYSGTVTNGLTITFNFQGPVTNPSIRNERTNQLMTIDSYEITNLTGTPLGNGDAIEINTVRGKRAVTLIRKGKRTNVLHALRVSSQWIELWNGSNPMSVSSDVTPENFQTQVRFDSLYTGI